MNTLVIGCRHVPSGTTLIEREQHAEPIDRDVLAQMLSACSYQRPAEWLTLICIPGGKP